MSLLTVEGVLEEAASPKMPAGGQGRNWQVYMEADLSKSGRGNGCRDDVGWSGRGTRWMEEKLDQEWGQISALGGSDGRHHIASGKEQTNGGDTSGFHLGCA